MAEDPINKQTTTPLDVRGRTGLTYFGGSVYEELHPKLTGTQKIRLYKEMSENDATVGAILFSVKMLMRQAKWEVQAAGLSRQEEADKVFVEQCLGDMSHTVDELIPEILTMLPFGWSLFELCYKRRAGDSRDPKKRSIYNDGKIGWRKIELRSQDSLDEWLFDSEGEVLGMWQMPPPTYDRYFIPSEKSLLFRTESTKGNPEGRSVLRSAFRSWWMKKRLEEIEAIGAERDLAGLPVLEVPPEVMHPSAPTELKTFYDDLKTLVSEVKRDERMGVVVPAEETAQGKTGYRFRLLNSGGRRQVDTNETILRYQKDIAMTLLAEFIMLGMDKVGSFALASTKTHMFAMAVGAWLKSIAAVFNKHAIPKLFEVNGMKRDKYPVLVPGDVETPDLTAIGTFLANLTKVGIVIPDEALHRKVRELANMPEPDEKTARVPEIKPNVRLDGDHTRTDQN